LDEKREPVRRARSAMLQHNPHQLGLVFPVLSWRRNACEGVECNPTVNVY